MIFLTSLHLFIHLNIMVSLNVISHIVNTSLTQNVYHCLDPSLGHFMSLFESSVMVSSWFISHHFIVLVMSRGAPPSINFTITALFLFFARISLYWPLPRNYIAHIYWSRLVVHTTSRHHHYHQLHSTTTKHPSYDYSIQEPNP